MISGLLETIVWAFDLNMSFNTRNKTLPYIISSKLNFVDHTINTFNTDHTKLMKLKFIMHVPMILKDMFYMVTKMLSLCQQKKYTGFQPFEKNNLFSDRREKDINF